jgi:anaerobic dimethyl sulfoxide reductase subunit B (iron-sulfur subunit)
MTQLGFFIDLTKCTGCQTCTVACKDAHNLEVGRNFRKVLEAESGSWKQDKATGAWHQDVCAYYVSISCNHCADPACVKVCPTKAHFKRKEDGLVLIDRDKCIGCGMCAKACPYGAPQLDTVAKKMTKCDACQDRLAKGLNPVCVDSCPQRAIEFGEMSELLKKHSDRKHIAPLPDPSVTKPNLLVKAPRNAKPVGDKNGTVFGADR